MGTLCWEIEVQKEANLICSTTNLASTYASITLALPALIFLIIWHEIYTFISTILLLEARGCCDPLSLSPLS